MASPPVTGSALQKPVGDGGTAAGERGAQAGHSQCQRRQRRGPGGQGRLWDRGGPFALHADAEELGGPRPDVDGAKLLGASRDVEAVEVVGGGAARPER